MALDALFGCGPSRLELPQRRGRVPDRRDVRQRRRRQAGTQAPSADLSWKADDRLNCGLCSTHRPAKLGSWSVSVASGRPISAAD